MAAGAERSESKIPAFAVASGPLHPNPLIRRVLSYSSAAIAFSNRQPHLAKGAISNCTLGVSFSPLYPTRNPWDVARKTGNRNRWTRKTVNRVSYTISHRKPSTALRILPIPFAPRGARAGVPSPLYQYALINPLHHTFINRLHNLLPCIAFVFSYACHSRSCVILEYIQEIGEP